MSAHLRILDAASNRAREALRVMEDIARFALDHAALATDLKHLRHRLQGALEATWALCAGAPAALAARDTPGDVGTSIQGSGEATRHGLAHVAAAAASRLTEALRSLEEASKLLGPGPAHATPPWQQFESIRYAAYDIQRRLGLTLEPPARQWRLCVLITGSLCTHWPWDVVAQRAVEGGADCLQLREKDLDSRELLARARRLVQIGSPSGASVIVNDRPDIALLAGADGVHLGQSDLDVADVRRLSARPDRRLLVGVSCSTLAHARAAAEAGADYLGLGPVFASGTKAKPVLAGVGLLESVVADPVASRLPHVAISGITPANVGLLLPAGCRGVAVSAAVCGARDPASVARALLL